MFHHREILLLTETQEDKLNAFKLLDNILEHQLTRRLTKFHYLLATTFLTIRFFTLNEMNEEKICGLMFDKIIEWNCKMPDELLKMIGPYIRS